MELIVCISLLSVITVVATEYKLRRIGDQNINAQIPSTQRILIDDDDDTVTTTTTTNNNNNNNNTNNKNNKNPSVSCNCEHKFEGKRQTLRGAEEYQPILIIEFIVFETLFPNNSQVIQTGCVPPLAKLISRRQVT
jgi:hypothetical protein